MLVAGQKTNSIWVWSLASVYAYYDYILNKHRPCSRSSDLFDTQAHFGCQIINLVFLSILTDFIPNKNLFQFLG